MEPAAFAKSMKEWCADTQQECSEAVVKVAKKLFKQIVENSPEKGKGRYSKGHFMRNWIVSDTANLLELPGETTSSAKNAEIDSVLQPDYFLDHHSVHFSNATEYANNVEFSGWKDPSRHMNTEEYRPVGRAFDALPM